MLDVLLFCRCASPVDSPGHSAEAEPYTLQGEATIFLRTIGTKWYVVHDLLIALFGLAVVVCVCESFASFFFGSSPMR